MYVSCDAKTIYRVGGWFEDGHLLNELSFGEASRRSPQFVAEMFAPYRYRRPMPIHLAAGEPFGGRLRDMYTTINEHYRAGAAAVLVHIENACVNNSTIYMVGDDKIRIIYETHRPNDRVYTPLKQPDELAAADGKFQQSPGECNLILSSIGSRNYGHWLVDDLPRIKAFHTLRKMHPKKLINILLPSFDPIIDSVRQQSIEAILSEAKRYEIRFYDPSLIYSFDSLYYVTPVSYHPMMKSPAALALISGSMRDRAAEKKTSLLSGSQRIFVTRRDVRGRVLTNGDEIEEVLRKNGFLVVDPDGMSFKEQASVFSNANLIVGCMGAAMTNTVFSDVATSVIMLAPEGWVEPFYWDLAMARGHSYSVCYGHRTQADDVPHKSSYSIQLDTLNQMLSSFT